MRKNIWHIPLEPIDGRYSKQWLECISREFEAYANKDYDGHDYWKMYDLIPQQIDQAVESVSEGGFLNFTATNRWKSQQLIQLTNLFEKGYILPGDTFLFTDAWNPAILNLRYMSDLANIPIRIVSYWHAGSYDPWDVLGYKIKDKSWSFAAERAFFHAADVNVFATKYHKNFFFKHCLGYVDGRMFNHELKTLVSGQPHYEIVKWFENCPPDVTEKEDIVLFPHRLCQEKQPEIFDELARRMPKYKFIRTQDYNLSKDEYYTLLLKSKVVFSCAMHEFLGISMMEGVLAGCMPVMPDRLSYLEMYYPAYRYPSKWADDKNVDFDSLKWFISESMTNHPSWLKGQKQRLIKNYLTSEPLWDALKE